VPPSSLTPTRPREVSAELADDLLLALGSVPDPRRDGGRRHPMAYVLGVLVMSFTCAGFGSFAASAQWAAAASARLLLMLVAAWTARLVSADQGGPRLAVAIDGKAVRGARVVARPAPHLLSAATHHTPVVLAQRQIPGKTNEIPMVTTLLDDLRAAGHDPSRMVFTLDALHTPHATARLLHEAGAGYVLTVKGNQPGLLAAVSAQVSAANPAPVRARSRGHARTSERLIQVAPATGIDFPGAARILRVAGVHRRARRSADPQRSCLRHHQLDHRSGQRLPARRPGPAALVDRELHSPCPRRDLRRGCQQGPDRKRSRRPGHHPQHRHHRATRVRSRQHPRRTTCRHPRPHRRHPTLQPRSKPGQTFAVTVSRLIYGLVAISYDRTLLRIAYLVVALVAMFTAGYFWSRDRRP
jgi:hypothetical protein